jgi:hypothetical protein
MSDRQEGEIVKLLTASSSQEAHLWRQALEGAGIPCLVVGRFFDGFGIDPPGPFIPELWVRRQYAQRARAVLESLRTSRPRSIAPSGC